MQFASTFMSVMAFGYLMLVGIVFIVMLIQVLAFYIAGRLTNSINDEFQSALSLFGALFLISVGSSLANAAIKVFMPESVIALVAAAVLFLFITIYAIKKIYDLSILASILHFIISFGIMVIALIGLGFLAVRFIPQGGFQGGFQMETDTTTNGTDEWEADTTVETTEPLDEATSDTEGSGLIITQPTETAETTADPGTGETPAEPVSAETTPETTVETPTDSGPSLPTAPPQAQ